jgi:hypothetical protein
MLRLGKPAIRRSFALSRAEAGGCPFGPELVLRFDYGASTPWVVRLDEWLNGIIAIAGPNMVVLRTPVEIEGRDMQTVGEFIIEGGQSVPFVLTYGPSHMRLPAPIDAIAASRETETFWSAWSSRCIQR